MHATLQKWCTLTHPNVRPDLPLLAIVGRPTGTHPSRPLSQSLRAAHAPGCQSRRRCGRGRRQRGQRGGPCAIPSHQPTLRWENDHVGHVLAGHIRQSTAAPLSQHSLYISESSPQKNSEGSLRVHGSEKDVPSQMTDGRARCHEGEMIRHKDTEPMILYSPMLECTCT